MKKTTRILSVLLSIAMLVCMIPQAVLAQVSEAFDEDKIEAGIRTDAEATVSDAVSDSAKYDISSVTALGEVVEQRTETTKTFRMSDGSYVAADYGKQIHYIDENGVLMDYDNALSYSASSDGEDFNGYITAKSDIKIKLANNSNSNNLLKLQSGDYKVSLHLVGADKSKALEIYSEIEKPEGEDITSVATLNKFTSGAIYKDILPSTDLEYIISGSSVKENIIVKEKGESYVYTFELKLNGLVPILLENGDIALNAENSGETELVIPKGIMYDAAGEYSDAVDYSITHKNGKKYTLTVTASADWINADGRVFPVTVDPTIEDGSYLSGEISDGYVYEGDPDLNTGSYQFSLAGYAIATNNLHMRSYFKLNELPELPDSAAIIYATLNLRQIASGNSWQSYSGTATELNFAARKITSSWTESGLTWNTKPSVDSVVLDYNTLRVNTGNRMFYWDITSAVQGWYGTDVNNGIAIYPITEYNGTGTYAHAGFYSSENPYVYSSTEPMFMIVYRDTKGLEGHWTYSSQSADGAGVGYVNGYNGNLVFVHNDMNTEGSVMPISVNHVYNSFQSGREFTSGTDVNAPITADFSNMSVGRGWKLSVQQTITTRIIDSTTYYVYNDEDGTERYFYALGNSPIKDEDGYGLVMTVSGSGTSKQYVIENEVGAEYTFDSDGRLVCITDVNGNKKTFTYSNGRLTQLNYIPNGSTAVEQLRFEYNTSGALNKIINAYNTNDYVQYLYSATISGTASSDSTGYLREIRYYNGTTLLKTLYYEYDSDGALISAKDGETQYSLNYEYIETSGNKRVSAVSEKIASAAGQTIGFEYGDNRFDIRTSGSDDVFDNDDDIYTVTLFDNYGQAICSYSTDDTKQEVYGASYAKYTEYDAFAETNHAITTSVSKGITRANYVLDGNCESTDQWDSYYSNSSYTLSKTESEKLFGNYSFKLSNSQTANGYFSQCQNITVPTAGTYTLSAYVKTVNVTSVNNGGAFLKLDGDESEYLTGTTNPAINNGWRRISITKEFAAAGTYEIVLKLMNATGNVYFDCVQLEKGDVPSDYNFIENSECAYNNFDVWNGGSYSFYGQGNGIGQLFGSPTAQNQATQEITVNCSVDTTFMLSGWAEANSVDLIIGGDMPENNTNSTVNAKTNRKFGLMATITYSDGTTEEHYEPFNPDYADWQYISFAVVSQKRSETQSDSVNISKITVAAVYDHNCNTMSFDNICLTVEPAQTYKYDSEGNIENVTDDDSNTSVMEYHENGIDLENYTAPTGEHFNYIYDDKHQVTEVNKTAGGNTQTAKYTYNSFGNIENVLITANGDDSLKITSSAVYTPDGNYLSQTVNELGKTTKYNYDSVTKLLKYVENANSVRTAYTYDNRDRVSEIYIDIDKDNLADSTEPQVQYLYDSGALVSIDNSKTVYRITYTRYNRIARIIAGSNLLASYEYAPNNGKLTKLTYGNGDSEEYIYDYLDRLVSVKYNGVVKYSIKIDANNRLYSLTENNTTHYYEYDSLGRLVRGWQEDANGNVTLEVENTYDEFGRSSGSTYVLPNKTQEYGITYKENSNLISNYTYPAGMNAYSYDCFDRLTNKNHTNLFHSNYTYVTDSQGNTSGLISSYRHTRLDTTNDLYSYTYDNLGNITSISKNGSVILSYEYDSLGQLTRENNALDNYTALFLYDTAGNITAKSIMPYTDLANVFLVDGTITTYTYGNSSWGDMLTAYGGTSITYDRIGNPLNWRNASSMVWVGRQLDTHNFANGDAVYYDYNSDGIRTRKLYWSDLYYTFRSHDYILDGTRILQETVDDGLTGVDYTLYYFYDESGVAGFEYNGVNYYFVKNIQGDVIEICSWNGGSVVQYTYDAWGKVLSITGSLASTVGQYNPFRYRSYYYDTETGFYYLNSRYYDPEVCRFLNADGFVSTGQGILGNNMFAYCNNNPVMFADENGCLPIPTIERIRMDNKWAEIAVKHFWGAIHTAVQLDIVANAYAKGYTSILKEWPVNGGRADILDASTGEVWEVKHNGHSSGVAAATISLAKYIPGTYSYNGNTYSTTLGHGGAFSGSLSDTALTGLSTHYDIVYWTEQPGVILYSFKITKPEQKAFGKSAIVAGATIALATACAIGISTAAGAGGGYGLNAGNGKGMGGGAWNDLTGVFYIAR